MRITIENGPNTDMFDVSGPVFVPTGEVRQPLAGEFFLCKSGFVIDKSFGWPEPKSAIYIRVEPHIQPPPPSFVPTGEFRVPNVGEWYLSPDRYLCENTEGSQRCYFVRHIYKKVEQK